MNRIGNCVRRNDNADHSRAKPSQEQHLFFSKYNSSPTIFYLFAFLDAVHSCAVDRLEQRKRNESSSQQRSQAMRERSPAIIRDWAMHLSWPISLIPYETVGIFEAIGLKSARHRRRK